MSTVSSLCLRLYLHFFSVTYPYTLTLYVSYSLFPTSNLYLQPSLSFFSDRYLFSHHLATIRTNDYLSTQFQSRNDSYESDSISVPSRNTILSDDSSSVFGYRHSRGSFNDQSDDHVSRSGDEGEATLVSDLGPKMRVHGRAPWETAEDFVSIRDRSHSPDGMSIFGPRKSGRSVIRDLTGRPMRSPSIPRLSFDSFSSSSQKGKAPKGSHGALQ